MSTFTSNITLTNNSKYTLQLNTGASSGLGSSWPATLQAYNPHKPSESTYQFQQGFDFQIKFVAVYDVERGSEPNESVGLQYYGDGVQKFSQSIQHNPTNVLTGSTYGESGDGHEQIWYTLDGSA
ncbi:MAG: hypothetical protein AAF560_18875 [Acidobacteriota bacterium]